MCASIVVTIVLAYCQYFFLFLALAPGAEMTGMTDLQNDAYGSVTKSIDALLDFANEMAKAAEAARL